MQRPTVLITGATGGLGRTVVAALAPDFRCVALYRDVARFEQLVKKVPALDGIACDLADEASIRSAFESARPWAVVHLAGGWAGGTIEETSNQQWSELLEANLHSAFRVLRQAMRSLPEGGRFVAIASAAALDNRTGMAAYVVAKSALVSLVRNAAAEAVGKLAINAVAPETIAPRGSSSAAVDPADIAATILYLLSDAGAAITGAVIPMSISR